VNSKWPKLMLVNGITSAWLLYDMATADRDPGPGACDPAICLAGRRTGRAGRFAGMLTSEK
jgi:hypothetical protein